MKILEYPTRGELMHWIAGLAAGFALGYALRYWGLI